MARTARDDFDEDDPPRQPPPESDEVPPESLGIDWKTAQLHVMQALMALKGEKSTPVLENVLYNLDCATRILRTKI